MSNELANSCETDLVKNGEDEGYLWVIARARHPKGPDGRREVGMLPEGFPFVVDRETGEVCEPVLLFLVEEHLPAWREGGGPNTTLAYAHALKDWLNQLEVEEAEQTWTSASWADLKSYCLMLSEVVSPQTGEAYAAATINQRWTVISSFYAWARRQEIRAVDVPDKNGMLGIEKQAESTAPTEAAPKARRTSGKSKKKERKSRKGRLIHVLQRGQSRALLEAMGPLPTDAYTLMGPTTQASLLTRAINSASAGSESSRDRLGAEIALSVGLRISEVCALNAATFGHLTTAPIDDATVYPISVRGKGKVDRDVHFHGVLIKDILHYIDNERSAVLQGIAGRLRTKALLVNGSRTGKKFAGHRVTSRSLERAFRSACIAVGFCSPVDKTYWEFADLNGQVKPKSVSAIGTSVSFVFHDLRHTFAVWTYYARKKSGDSEPWLYIQARLGHILLSTTTDTYLSTAGDFEATMTNTYMSRLNA